MKVRLKIILILTIVFVCTYFTYTSNNHSDTFHKNTPKVKPNVYYEVVKVLDGDTFEVDLEGQVVSVRMLGIDTPETIDPRKLVQCFGKEASEKTNEVLIGHTVSLMTDDTQDVVDRYGRVLAYVHRNDGLFINKYLLENGYAREYTYKVPYEKQAEFKDLEKTAKDDGKGLWGDTCSSI